jgi:hypothetical protein
MFRLTARIVSTVAALLFAPVPAHAKTARSVLVGEAPSTPDGTAETGERGARRQTLDGAPSPAYPECEDVPGWAPHPAYRAELSDAALAYRVAVWTEEVSRG